MSVAEAEEFYGPVLPVLEKKLGPKNGRAKLGKHCGVHGGPETERMSAERT
jgi:hypothetical protein